MRLTQIRIAARHSDLARLQARSVGRALQAAHPGLRVEYEFRASLGDVNLHDPLWKMPEKGVFTEDFVADLKDGRADLVVHSWKDMPTAPREWTEVAGTLARADARDLLLFRRDRLERARETGAIRVLTSSPRRAHNLDRFFRFALPFEVRSIAFENVRGNVPTRVGKLLSGDVDGLIVAKAALDRLLETESWGPDGEEYSGARAQLRAALAQCRWMALPLSENPCAAAQGALAIEIRKDRDDVRELVSAVNCQATFSAVLREREILSGHGGGCHQKIGAAVIDRDHGRAVFVRGLTEAGVALDSARLERRSTVPRASGPDALYPGRDSEAGQLFEREPLPRESWEPEARAAEGLWIARESGLPAGYAPRDGQIVWCAGVKSWRKLAARGAWVNGCADGLGEIENPRADVLHGGPVSWRKLSHSDSADEDGIGPLVATYRLKPRSTDLDRAARAEAFRGKTHFFWMSGTALKEALRIDPGLRTRGHHACGPGKTAQVVARELGVDPRGEPGRFAICLGVEAWRAEALEEKG